MSNATQSAVYRRLILGWSVVLFLSSGLFDWRASFGQDKPAEKGFEATDSDRNGYLSKDEFLTPVPKPGKVKAARDFTVVDWNSDGQLSLAEFNVWRFLGEAAKRGAVPDPISDRASAKIAALKGSWKQWDTNGDDSLDVKEFPAFLQTKPVPGLDGTDFKVWDLDQNSKLEQAEAVRIVQAAYGVQRVGGFELRSPEGQVFDLMTFVFWDVDGDDRLTSAEIEKRAGLDAKAASKRVADLDRDGDQKLSREETRALLTIDVLAQFLAMDSNLDGACDWMEWKASILPWQQQIAFPIFRAFDRDADHKLSFREYRETPFANLLAAWHEPRSDQNSDGQLDLAEFRWVPLPLCVALEAEWFALLDLDHNGQLGLEEFHFNTSRLDGKRTFARLDINADGQVTGEEFEFGVPSESGSKSMVAAFDADRNGRLSLTEFRSIPSVESAEQRTPIPDPLQLLMEQNLKQITEKWKAWDTNQNGELDQVEFAASELKTLVPGCADIAFASWDIAKKGKLTSANVERVLRIAYGLARPDGGSTHSVSGLDMNWMQFKELDRNHDLKLDQAEFGGLGPDRKKSAEIMSAADQNKDSKIDLAEWERHKICHLDIHGTFGRIDANHDQFLSRDELLAGVLEWQKPIARHLFPGFDTDADDQLTMSEFRLTPLANLQQKWQEPRLDADNDGYLTLDEFSWKQDLDATALTAIFFERLDVSKDGKLDLNEYFFATSRRNVGREFAAQDKDKNELLSESEFQANVDPSQTAASRRDFRLFDENGDGSLTLEEYRQIPSRNGWQDRLAPPDPVVGMAMRLKTALEPVWKGADKNSDGQLETLEFQKSGISRKVPGLELTRTKDWDLDESGSVSESEINRVVDAALGVKRLDGLAYREPSGIVHNAMLFKYADESRDDRVSYKEYMTRGYGGSGAANTFVLADKDRDGFLTYQEWIADPVWNVDPIADFLRLDTNFDGQLSDAELNQGTPEWQLNRSRTTTAAFDDNKDGMLSLFEYRLTPLANPLASWQEWPSDKDMDGRLTIGEYYDFPTLEIAGLSREYFHRYDLNSDERLGLDEHWFHLDVARVPAEIAFAFRDADRNQSLTLEEVLADLLIASKRSSDPGIQHQLATTEEAFHAADTDGDNQLSLTEFNTDLGRAVFNPAETKRLQANARLGRNSSTGGKTSWRFTLLVLINLSLVGGAAWYVLFRSPGPE